MTPPLPTPEAPATETKLPYKLTDCGERGQTEGTCCGQHCVDCTVWSDESIDWN